MTLMELGKKYVTDKVIHNYLPIYEQVLITKQIDRVLEIGVGLNGPSLKMWSEYYPKAWVVGWDLENLMSPQDLYGHNISTFLVNQSSRESMKSWFDENGQYFKNGLKFDLIVDDGSHRQHDMQTSLGFLWDYLDWGGIYIIEDLHVCFKHNMLEYIGGGTKEDNSNSTFEFLKRIEKDKTVQSEYITELEAKNICLYCKSCKVIDVDNDEKHITAILEKIC
jgi:hypothetical protein